MLTSDLVDGGVPLGWVQIKRKLVVVGDGATGKTSLLSVFSMGEFPSQ